MHEGHVCWAGVRARQQIHLQENQKEICQDSEESGLIRTYLVSDSRVGLQILTALPLSCHTQSHLRFPGNSLLNPVARVRPICSDVQRQWTVVSTLICNEWDLLWLAWIILITHIISFIEVLVCYKSCFITCLPPGLSYKMILLQPYSSWN